MAGPGGRATAGGLAARRRDPRRRGASRHSLEADRRQRFVRDADIGHRDIAADARPVAGQQTGLGQSEGDGHVGAHTGRVGDASVRIETGRNVDGDHAQPRRVDGLYELREATLWRSVEAGAEDRVEHQICSNETGPITNLDAQLEKRIELAPRLAAQSRPLDAAGGREAAPAVEVASGGQAVARVVADAADHRGAPFARARRLPARGLHQPVERDAETLGGEPVELLDLSASQGWAVLHRY